MGSHRPRRRPGLAALRLALAGIAVSGGAVALLVPSPRPEAPSAAAAVVARPWPVPSAAIVPVRVPAPTRVHIPSLGVDSTLTRLGVDPSGALETPEDFDQAGWFSDGPVPGSTGPAVIAGHVDSWTGPAVFSRLAELAVGDVVLVDRDDGTTAQFTVTHVTRHPKTAFPTDDVYGPTTDAQLRLVTCGGDFDRSIRSYVDNVVVFAELAGLRPTVQA